MAVEQAIAGVPGVLLANDVATAAARLDEAPAGAAPPVLVVVGPEAGDPLSVAMELTRIDDAVAVAFLVEPHEEETLRQRLGLVPKLRGATVLAQRGSVDDLQATLAELATAAARRRELSNALSEMNQRLVGPGRHQPTRREGVSESYLAALIRHVPDAIVSVDSAGKIVAINDGAVRTFRTDRSAAEGQPVSAALGPAGGEIGPLVGESLAGQVRAAEINVDTQEGRISMSVTAAPVRDHAGRMLGAVIVARDVTEQRRTQDRLRELQKAQSLATLAGGVAHDFNNLLVTVSSWAELAAEQPDDTEFVATALARIQASAQRAAELARSMLVYSGRGHFRSEPVDLTDLVGDMADLLAGAINRKVELRLELTDELPSVEADASQLRQVVMNLVTNAAEAMEGLTGTITARTYVTDAPSSLAQPAALPPGRYVVVEVADTGPGMDEHTAARVFEPFFTTKFEGRGLGLAASYGIVRAHGGSLTVESQLGQGATFRMLLPALDEATTDE